MAWHKIRRNDGESVGSIHIGLGVASCIEPGGTEHRGPIDRFLRVCAVGSRLEAKTWTRGRGMAGAEAATWWDWLATWCGGNRTVTVWAWGLGRCLTLLDVAAAIERKELQLEWKSKPRLRKNGTRPAVKNVRGLLCLEDSPTIIVLRHVLGARIQLLDARNFYRCEHFRLCPGWSLPFPRAVGPGDDYSAAIHAAMEWADLAERCGHEIVDWVRRNDLGVLRTTIAAQAMGAYRHRGMKHSLVSHDEPAVAALERLAYYGGETELFYCGHVVPPRDRQRSALAEPPVVGVDRPAGPIFRMDCNALFPFVMENGNFPQRLVDWSGRPGCAADPTDYTPSRMIAAVLIESKTATYPYRRAGQTLYATGRFWTALAGLELHAAIQAGHVREWGQWACYETAPIFSGWMTELYERRQVAILAGNMPEGELWKGLANCLYGKFGQLTPRWGDIADVDLGFDWGTATLIDRELGRMRQFRAIGGRIQEQIERLPKKNSLTAISAFITAAARVYMQGVRRLLPRGSLYYQGIDSLHCHSAGVRALEKNGLVAASCMGKMRLEAVADSATYWGRADYQFGAERVYCGAKSAAEWVGAHAFSQAVCDSIGVTLTRGPGAMIEVRELTVRGGKPYQLAQVGLLGWCSPIVIHDETPLAAAVSAASPCPAAD